MNRTYEETRKSLDHIIKYGYESAFIRETQYQINKMFSEMTKVMEDSMIYGTGLIKIDKDSNEE